MDDLAKKQFEEDKMVNDAFQHLIDTYLASFPHAIEFLPPQKGGNHYQGF